jgi:hypothetical protein
MPSKANGIEISIEASPKKTFATAVDWPGWSRSGKTEDAAVDALAAAASRYAVVVHEAGMRFPAGAADRDRYEIVERTGAGSGTDFGVPSSITDLDRRPVDAADARRHVRLLDAVWTVFDRVASSAPAELRKGPRGGGRDRDKMIAHVIESEWYYAREMGLREKQPDVNDRAAVDALREAMLDILGRRSDGSPLAGRKWPPRYAVRRTAWHGLDHAWEMEDRTEPA